MLLGDDREDVVIDCRIGNKFKPVDRPLFGNAFPKKSFSIPPRRANGRGDVVDIPSLSARVDGFAFPEFDQGIDPLLL